MSNFNIHGWYKGTVAAATALLGVGAVAQDRGLLVFAVGLLLLGVGEWINHPFQSQIIPPGPGLPGGGIASGEVRSPKVLGLLLDVIGLLLFGLGLYHLVKPLL